MVFSVLLFLIFVSSLDSIESRYALVITNASNCMVNSKVNIVLHKNTPSGLAKSDTVVGYVELLEAVEPNHNFMVSIETHHRGISDLNKIPSINVKRTDFCNYLSTDLLLMPLVRRTIDLEKFCPVAKSRYALVLKEGSNCMQNSKMHIVLYKNTSSLPKGNTRAAGYFEFVEEIQSNRNFQVKVETHHRGISDSTKMPSLNVQRTDLCNYISTDLLFVPLIRRVFDLEKFCPVAKGKHIVYKDTLVSRYRPYIPLGCWIIIVRITKQQSEPFACFNTTVQSLPSLKSELYKCT